MASQTNRPESAEDRRDHERFGNHDHDFEFKRWVKDFDDALAGGVGRALDAIADKPLDPTTLLDTFIRLYREETTEGKRQIEFCFPQVAKLSKKRK